MTQVAVPTGYNKPIKRFAVRAVMMMMSPTTKLCLRRRRSAGVRCWTDGRVEGAGPIYLLPNVLTGVTLSVMGEEKEGIVFLPPRRPSRWMTVVVRPVGHVCPGGFIMYLSFTHSLATLQVSRQNSIAMTFEN